MLLFGICRQWLFTSVRMASDAVPRRMHISAHDRTVKAHAVVIVVIVIGWSRLERQAVPSSFFQILFNIIRRKAYIKRSHIAVVYMAFITVPGVKSMKALDFQPDHPNTRSSGKLLISSPTIPPASKDFYKDNSTDLN